MKPRNLIAFISFAVFTTIATSCGDSYMPITLVSLDGNTIYTNNDTISLPKFSDGEQFDIKGGNGLYYVKAVNKDNSDDKVIRYSQEDNRLSIVPQKEGFSLMSIKDSEENETRIVVEVEKIDKVFSVERLEVFIKGNKDFTFGEKDELTERIIANAFVKVGGRFEFQYTKMNNGIAKIKPTGSSDYISGTFTQETIYDEQNGSEILSFRVMLPGQGDMILSLSARDLTISEDLTETYKPHYANLESAILKYKLSIPTEQNQNDK